MKRASLLAGLILLMGTYAYAGNGDLIVDGNVGVGTTSPQDALDLGHGTSGRSLIWGGGSGANHYASIGTSYSSASLSLLSGLKLNKASDQYLVSYSGVFGHSGSRFEYGTGNIYFFTEPATARNIGDAFDYTSNTRLIIQGNGNVGIGTTNPINRLSVYKAVGTNDYTYTAQHYMQVRITNGLGTLASKAMEIGILDNGTGIIQANEAGVGYNNLLLNPVAGDVGIGTGATTPRYKLDVQGTIGMNGALVLTSDIRFKKNFLPILSPLDKVLNLNGLTYEWKTDEYKDKGFQDGRHYGVIAQEIEKVLPEVVNTAPDGTKAVAYTEIIPVLIEAIKEQQKMIMKQQEELKEIRALILK